MNIIEEGGSAVNGRPIRQSEVPLILDRIEGILSELGLKREDDWDIVGSAGKKKEGDTSGDIDICIKSDRMMDAIGNNDKKGVLEDLAKHLSEKGYGNAKVYTGFNQVSFAMPMESDEDVVQVDFILVRNLGWSKFMQSSPDYRKDESKYKSHCRNVLVMCITKTCFKRTTKRVTLEDDTIKDGEVETYVVRLTDGLYKTRRNWFGKKGDTIIKTVNRMHEYDELITDTPQEFIDLLFDGATIADFNSFETVYALLMSDKFKFPEHRDKIIVSYVMSLDEQKIDIPSEIEQKYIDEAREKEEMLKNEPRQKLKIKNIEVLEHRVLGFDDFVNMLKERS